MEIARGFEAKDRIRMNHLQNGSAIGMNSDILLVIWVPDSQVLRIVSRSLFFAMVILTLPFINSILREISESPDYNLSIDEFASSLVNAETLDSLLLDLANEGHIKKGDKAFFVCSKLGFVIENSRFLNSNEIDWIIGSKHGDRLLFNDESFDFVFAFGFEDSRFLDRILKVNGVLVTQLSDFLSSIQKQSNFKVIYLRKHSSTIVGTRKTSLTTESNDSTSMRQLSKSKMESKRAALSGLEDILLEPPRKPNEHFKQKFKYLPDLLGDSLDEYSRRIFLDVSSQEESEKVLTWFNEKYPKRNKKFEMYSVETVGEGVPDVTNWLAENVKENEFVVMKAEAEVVGEMLKKGSIGFVDELFLECENQWDYREGKAKNKRAYWECLALYGRLRDTGVAVHQWW